MEKITFQERELSLGMQENIIKYSVIKLVNLNKNERIKCLK